MLLGSPVLPTVRGLPFGDEGQAALFRCSSAGAGRRGRRVGVCPLLSVAEGEADRAGGALSQIAAGSVGATRSAVGEDHPTRLAVGGDYPTQATPRCWRPWGRLAVFPGP